MNINRPEVLPSDKEFITISKEVDINGDGKINGSDVSAFIESYFETHPYETIDLNAAKASTLKSVTVSSADTVNDVIENYFKDHPKTNVVYGDANHDGNVTVADAVAIMQFIGNRDKYDLSPEGKIAADVDGVPGITGTDALTIQKVDAGIYKLEELPLKSK